MVAPDPPFQRPPLALNRMKHFRLHLHHSDVAFRSQAASLWTGLRFRERPLRSLQSAIMKERGLRILQAASCLALPSSSRNFCLTYFHPPFQLFFFLLFFFWEAAIEHTNASDGGALYLGREAQAKKKNDRAFFIFKGIV